jgi:hypothetical protein
MVPPAGAAILPRTCNFFSLRGYLGDTPRALARHGRHVFLFFFGIPFMLSSFRSLDRLLRGDATRMDALRSGTIDVPIPGTTVLLCILGMVYGACMGIFSLTLSDSQRASNMQIVASTVKVPLLFIATLLVTFPSLYVFNALVGSRLRFVAVVKLMLGAMGVTMAVLASLGPIVGFFSVSSTSVVRHN